jgi:ABC-type molybdate transport system substrate-binding protein
VIVRALARVLLAALALSSAAARADESLRLYAAGSLRGAMTEVARSYTASTGTAVTPTFGSSGLLRERIEREGGADVFASADTGHPDALAAAGRAAPPVVFARNRLCALIAPGVEVTRETLLDRMLDPAVKLGTSTPKADPSGDYAWQVFELADKIRPGAYATLDRKALKLTGGPALPTTTPDRSVYGVMLAERKADIFLAYCTAGLDVVREVPGSRVVALPEPLAVGASYSLTVLNGARPGADRLALYILSRPAQEILAKYGFTPIALP